MKNTQSSNHTIEPAVKDPSAPMEPQARKDSDVHYTFRAFMDAGIDFIGGTLGGVATVYIGQPLDTVKVKIQTFPTEYRNALHCFMRTFQQDGVRRGLYAGTVPSLVANVAENSILFLFYGLCQKGIAFVLNTPKVSDLGIVSNACAGSSAAFFSSLSLCPTELIKCRLQAMREMAMSGQLEGGLERLKVGPWRLTSEIVKAEGIRGLFVGLTSTFIREMPGYFFFFGGYELSRRFFTKSHQTKDEIGAVRTMVSGGLGGMALWVAIFPADVIKSRIQVQSMSNVKTPTFRETFVHIIKNEGPRSLYKGLGPTILRTFPATGALFLTYETTKKVLGLTVDRLY